jgi:phage-related protein
MLSVSQEIWNPKNTYPWMPGLTYRQKKNLKAPVTTANNIKAMLWNVPTSKSLHYRCMARRNKH